MKILAIILQAQQTSNGFSVKKDLYVEENAGKNAGQKAHFIVTFIFTPS